MSTEICIFPASFAQQRLWFLDQLEPGNVTYNIARAIYLTGPIDVATLETSINEIVKRHESLRTTFGTRDGKPVQVVRDESPILLPLIDLSALPPAERANEEQRLAQAEAHRPFDLSEGPLLRGRLVRLADEEHVLLLTLHHIISDGWSAGILFRELATLYEAFRTGKPSPLPPLTIQYADYAVWQRELLQGDVLMKQLSYWREQLADPPTALELPADRPHQAIQTLNGAVKSLTLSAHLTDALKTLSQSEGVTLFMLLLAAFQGLLFRYTGEDDILVGSPFAGRNRIETEEVIGFFINTVVLRTSLSGNPSFRELLQRVRNTSLEAFAHQDLPFEKLIEELRPDRNRSYTPLFQVMFAPQNAPKALIQLNDGLSLRPVDITTDTARFDLTLLMDQDSDPLSCSLEYNTDLFDEDRIVRMLGHFVTLLGAAVANPEQTVGELALLNEKERQQILVGWNDTATAYDSDLCLHELFEKQVAQTPENIAVVFSNQQLSYRELNEKANQLAHYLRRSGVGAETLVGICLERSIEMVIGLLGILKAGGAYVPIDPAYPKERLAFMLEDSSVTVLITQQSLLAGLPEHGAQVVQIDEDWHLVSLESEANSTLSVVSRNLAYVIYTSGSTGHPKGVAIEHTSTVAFLNWALANFSSADLAAVLASTSICFDLSVFEIFAPLCSGGKVVLVENALHLPDVAAQKVSMVNTVPSAITELVRTRGIPPTAKIINLAGEPLARSLVQQIYGQKTVREVLNLYGPTEDTTYSTFARLTEGATEEPSIGRPITNTQVYLLDSRLQPVPVGVPGELHLGGAGLARGYLHRNSLTAEKFIPNPFSQNPGARLYKTGDLARYRRDGNIEYLGRTDYQVKVRGFRIELGEIESALNELPEVRQAVVVVREESTGKRLVAYIVPDQQHTGLPIADSRNPVQATAEPDWTSSKSLVKELREQLQKTLPEYMVPAAFVLLPQLPLTSNGKIDRRALPQPEAPATGTAFVAPRTASEEKLAAIWAAILDLEKVGIQDNFFDLGGHSLLATQLVSRIRDSFGLEITLGAFFTAPTIEGVMGLLEKSKVSQDDSGALSITRVARQSRQVTISEKGSLLSTR
jgi:amino acid adenylation domain-containing protein